MQRIKDEVNGNKMNEGWKEGERQMREERKKLTEEVTECPQKSTCFIHLSESG
jgi:hypothetical protein